MMTCRINGRRGLDVCDSLAQIVLFKRSSLDRLDTATEPEAIIFTPGANGTDNDDDDDDDDDDDVEVFFSEGFTSPNLVANEFVVVKVDVVVVVVAEEIEGGGGTGGAGGRVGAIVVEVVAGSPATGSPKTLLVPCKRRASRTSNGGGAPHSYDIFIPSFSSP
jgi:hypothetical protein